MADIEIYTKPGCPFCQRAKALLGAKGADYREYDISSDESLREEMIRRSGRKTVPEVFVDGELLGGCDDLVTLDSENRLDEALKL